MYVLPFGQMSLWGENCLTCLFNEIYPNNYFLLMPLSTNSKRGISRIGPHDQIIYSIIFGSLLGDAHAEKRNGNTRISFYQESTHLSYLIWLHDLLSSRGYCNPILPKIQTKLGVNGVVRKVMRFHTWNYTSFNWIHDIFYKNQIKQVPPNIAEYLTPIALAIWIMDDGTKSSKGLKLCTNCFSYSDCLLLVDVLYFNFQLKSSIQSAGNNQYIIYIWKESIPKLKEITFPYIIKEMRYKLIH